MHFLIDEPRTLRPAPEPFSPLPTAIAGVWVCLGLFSLLFML